MPPARTIGPEKKEPDCTRECEWVQPARLAASACRQQHQPVRPGVDRAFGVTDARDVGEDQRPGVMKRGNDGAR